MNECACYKLIGPERGVSREPTSFYMMNSLLYSRMECGHPSNDEYFDEDVNVYLANLLTSFMSPAYHATICTYVVPYDISLFERVASFRDPRTKYVAYKTNADYLLIQLGIYGNPRGGRAPSADWARIDVESYIGRVKVYYNLAQSYLTASARRPTAAAEVLGKLSRGLEKYLRVLSWMRGEYFNMVRRMSDGELFHLGRSVERIDEREETARLYDRFLDAYSAYRRLRSVESREILLECAVLLREADPGFRFDETDLTSS